MTGEPDLLAAIDALPPLRWSGTAYRHTARGRLPLSGEGARRAGGRWNPRGSYPVLYLADSLSTCEAEFRRMAGLQGRAVDDFLPRALHVIQCTEVRMLDLRGMDAQTAVGLDPADLVSDDRGACQAVGEAAHFLDFDGVLAPSAAAPATGVVVALFIDKTDSSAVTFVATTDFNPSSN